QLSADGLRTVFDGCVTLVKHVMKHRLITRVDEFGASVGEWRVRGDDTSAIFKSERAAVVLIAKAALAEAPILVKLAKDILKSIAGIVRGKELTRERVGWFNDLMAKRKSDNAVAKVGGQEALRRVLDDDNRRILGDVMGTHVNSGSEAALDDPTN